MESITLFERESECINCGTALVAPKFGIPMYEGRAVPHDYDGEWAGFDACPICYALYQTFGPDGLLLISAGQQ